MAALLGTAAVGVAWWFDLPLNLDPDANNFNPIIFVPSLLGVFALDLYSAVRGTLLARRFGASSLEIAGESVPLGGRLKGRIRTYAPQKGMGCYALFGVIVRAKET